MTSPTQRSLVMLREWGWTCQVVERWNQYARRRVDLFGVIDIVAIEPERSIIGVQTTTMSNASTHREKISKSAEAREWVAGGGVLHLHLWRKIGKPARWKCRVEEWDGTEFYLAARQQETE